MAVVSDDAAGIARAAEAVRNGKVIIFPTETCYGIGCDATDEDAVGKVYRAKDRSREKKLTVIVSDLAMAERYADLTDAERELVEAFMPGPLTIIAAKTEGFPDITNTDFAFRIPGNGTARELARRADVPVVATSANVAGGEENYRVDDISAGLRDAADVVIDAGELGRTAPSTVIGIRDGELTVHRDGPVTREEIEVVLHGG